MKLRYRFLNEMNDVLFSNFSDDEIKYLPLINKPSMLLNVGKRALRAGVFSNADGTVYGISSDDNYLRSSKKFSSELEALGNTLEAFTVLNGEYRKQLNANTSRLIHNLVTLNAHNIQEVYSIVPQESLSNGGRDKVATVASYVTTDPEETALALLKIAKNNAAMKTEFAVFNKLFDSNPRLEKKNHNVHKVLMNILYLFFPDFTDKQVYVNVKCDENSTAFFDYESFHVAMYHLIENAVKYVAPKSNLNITIETKTTSTIIELDMISLQIGENERESIFVEGVSGEFSKKTHKSGAGIGLNRAKRILELNGGNIFLKTDPDSLREIRGVPFQRNIFQIQLVRK